MSERPSTAPSRGPPDSAAPSSSYTSSSSTFTPDKLLTPDSIGQPRIARHPTSPDLSHTYVINEISSKSTIEESDYHGLLNASLLAGYEEELELPQHTAMVFDCGSGESKAMLMRFNRVGPTGRCVSVSQVSEKLPSVTDFLKESVVPKDRFAFLEAESRPADPDTAVLRPEHFVRYCVEQRAKHRVDYVLIGCSAWYVLAWVEGNVRVRTTCC
jgi:hypothetical protein